MRKIILFTAGLLYSFDILSMNFVTKIRSLAAPVCSVRQFHTTPVIQQSKSFDNVVAIIDNVTIQKLPKDEAELASLSYTDINSLLRLVSMRSKAITIAHELGDPDLVDQVKKILTTLDQIVKKEEKNYIPGTKPAYQQYIDNEQAKLAQVQNLLTHELNQFVKEEIKRDQNDRRDIMRYRIYRKTDPSGK